MPYIVADVNSYLRQFDLGFSIFQAKMSQINFFANDFNVYVCKKNTPAKFSAFPAAEKKSGEQSSSSSTVVSESVVSESRERSSFIVTGGAGSRRSASEDLLFEKMSQRRRSDEISKLKEALAAKKSKAQQMVESTERSRSQLRFYRNSIKYDQGYEWLLKDIDLSEEKRIIDVTDLIQVDDQKSPTVAETSAAAAEKHGGKKLKISRKFSDRKANKGGQETGGKSATTGKTLSVKVSKCFQSKNGDLVLLNESKSKSSEGASSGAKKEKKSKTGDSKKPCFNLTKEDTMEEDLMLHEQMMEILNTKNSSSSSGGGGGGSNISQPKRAKFKSFRSKVREEVPSPEAMVEKAAAPVAPEETKAASDGDGVGAEEAEVKTEPDSRETSVSSVQPEQQEAEEDASSPIDIKVPENAASKSSIEDESSVSTNTIVEQNKIRCERIAKSLWEPRPTAAAEMKIFEQNEPRDQSPAEPTSRPVGARSHFQPERCFGKSGLVCKEVLKFKSLAAAASATDDSKSESNSEAGKLSEPSTPVVKEPAVAFHEELKSRIAKPSSSSKLVPYQKTLQVPALEHRAPRDKSNEQPLSKLSKLTFHHTKSDHEPDVKADLLALENKELKMELSGANAEIDMLKKKVAKLEELNEQLDGQVKEKTKLNNECVWELNSEKNKLLAKVRECEEMRKTIKLNEQQAKNYQAQLNERDNLIIKLKAKQFQLESDVKRLEFECQKMTLRQPGKQTNIDDYLNFAESQSPETTAATNKSQERCCSIPNLLTAATTAAAAASTASIMNSSSLTKVEATKYAAAQPTTTTYTTTVIDASTLKRSTNHLNPITHPNLNLNAKPIAQLLAQDSMHAAKSQQQQQHKTSYSYCASKPQTMLFRSPSINNVQDKVGAAQGSNHTMPGQARPFGAGLKKSYSNAGQINFQSPSATTCIYHPYEFGGVGSAGGHQKAQNAHLQNNNNNNNSKLYIIDKQTLAESEKTPMMIRLISYKKPGAGGDEQQGGKKQGAYGSSFLHRTPTMSGKSAAESGGTGGYQSGVGVKANGLHSKIPHLFKCDPTHNSQQILGLESELQTLLHRQRQLDLELRLLAYKSGEACTVKLQSELILVENKISYINTELRRLHDKM